MDASRRPSAAHRSSRCPSSARTSGGASPRDRKSTRLNSSHSQISYAVFCLKKNNVVSISRKPVWSMNAEEIKALYAAQDADAKANPVKRGEYLLEAIGCAHCHSAVDEQTRL